MFVNEMGMGSAPRAEGTYGVQSCMVELDNPATPQIDSVPRPGLDPSIMACTQSSVLEYGFPANQWPKMLNGSTTIRMPFGISFSARGDYRGGEGFWRSTNAMGSAVGRNARSPVCLPYYQNTVSSALRVDTPAIWVDRCHPSLATAYNHPGGEFKLRTISAAAPLDFLFPDRVQNATLTLVMGEVLTINNSLWNNYPPGVSERVPPVTTLRASIRITF
jgi:hypothetical protein